MTKPRITFKAKGMINKVYRPFLLGRKRLRIFFGGSASGKSVFCADDFVLTVLKGGNVLVVRKVAKTLVGSVWNEILKSIHRMRVRHLFEVNKSDRTITAKNNGKQFVFAGLDDVEKIKSITAQRGVITDIWVEEATEITYDDYKQLQKRLRGQAEVKKQTTLTFNPVYKTHWIYTEFFKGWDESKNLYEDDDKLILKTTHKDNEFLAVDDHEALENETDEYYKNVYTFGNWGVLGDVIYKNWHTEDLTEQIEHFDNIRQGLDFGFTAPFGFIKLHLDQRQKRIYIFEEVKEKALTNTMIFDTIKKMAGRRLIIADSAETKSIQELSNAGLDIIGATKGADSVWHGIQWIKNYEIIVHTTCIETINELTLYQWQKDKDGESIKRPVKKNDHLLDAMRYALDLDINEYTTATARMGSLRI